MRSAVACWPRMARAGSPGSSNVATKTSRDTSHSTARLTASLRRIRRVMSRLLACAEPGVAELVAAQRDPGPVGDQPGDVHLVGVDLVDEAPDDQPAAFVLDLLCLFDQ